jgi:coxsackievirus/adenovirus receptor
MLIKRFQFVVNWQAQWVKDYQDEVDRLQTDVQNIEDISNSLPDGCWKRVQLEP